MASARTTPILSDGHGEVADPQRAQPEHQPQAQEARYRWSAERSGRSASGEPGPDQRRRSPSAPGPRRCSRRRPAGPRPAARRRRGRRRPAIRRCSSRRGSQACGSSPTSCAQLVEQPHGALAARQHGQQLRLAGEVEPRHHAVGPVLDQEAARGVGQGADQVELVLGQAEALAVVARPAPWGWA